MGLENVKLAIRMAQRGFGIIPDSTHEACPHDIVVPLSVFDNNFIFRNQYIRLAYRFESVLSPAKLRRSLEGLITDCGWEKLGARLRSLGNKLEFHVPTSFGPGRPPLRFSLQDLSSSSIDEHKVLSKPLRTRAPITVVNVQETGRFFQHSNAFADLGYFVTQDIPLLGLDIMQFADATLIFLSCPHVLIDGMGLQALLKTWAAHLQGREKHLLQPCKPTEDPLGEFGLQGSREFWLERHRRSTAIFMLENTLFQNAAAFVEGTEPRSVLLSDAFVRSLRDQSAMDNQIAPPEFVSEGDLISAWWLRQVTSRCMPRFVQTVTMYQLVSYHSRIDSKLRDPKSVYIGNAVGFFPMMMSRRDLEKDSIVELAVRVRRSLDKATDPDQLEAYAASFRESAFALMPNFGHGLTFSMVISNATKLKLLDFDLSGALPDQGRTAGGMSHPPCVPSALYNFQDFAFPYFFTIAGKDHLGNCLITGNLRRKEWEAIESGWFAGELGNQRPCLAAKL